jgi:ankyrin repeat protein
LVKRDLRLVLAILVALATTESAAPMTTAPVAPRNALIEAAKQGDAVALSAADRDALSTTDGLGRAPLHYAARLGHVAAVDALLAAGVAVDQTDADGFTPLLRAAQGGDANLPIVRRLLAAGADPSAVAQGADGAALARAAGGERVAAAIEAATRN